MPLMDFINKYRMPSPDTRVKGTAQGATVSFNTAADKQRADMQAAATGEARQLASTEEQLSEQKKQRGLQSIDEAQQYRNESTSQKQKYLQASQQLSSELSRNLTTLSEREKLDRMEAASQATRLADEKYAFTLADEGRRRRLTDARQFDLALKESVFEDEVDLIRNDIKFKELLDQDDQSFQIALSNMDLATALTIATQKRNDANKSSVISGGTDIIKSVAGYYAGRKTETPTTPETPQGVTSSFPTYDSSPFRMQGVN
jgi:hypothetical protein